MSKQTKHRYLNSFFITTILYLVTSFFLFYVFADTLVEEKKPEEVKISIKQMMTQQEPTPIQPISEPLSEATPPLEPVIEKNKTYPKTAKRLNQTGKVYVTFIITKDGRIKNCKIEKSSQFDSLDEASLEILTKIANFEAIPEELNKDSWEITVPIVYQIS